MQNAMCLGCDISKRQYYESEHKAACHNQTVLSIGLGKSGYQVNIFLIP